MPGKPTSVKKIYLLGGSGHVTAALALHCTQPVKTKHLVLMGHNNVLGL